MRKRNSDERGQSMVLITLAMVGLIAFLALVVDGGMAFAARRQMQNAADAGTVAGVRSLFPVYYDPDKTSKPDYEIAIYDQVKQYAQANGVDDPTDPTQLEAWFIDSSQEHTGTNPLPGNGGIPADAVGVEVTASTSFGSFFARVIGRNELGASAEAASILVEHQCGGAYAVWGDSCDPTCGVDLTGSYVEVIGSVHSNSDAHLTGSVVDVTGRVEYCLDFVGPGAEYALSPWTPPWCTCEPWIPRPWYGLNIKRGRFDVGGDLADEAALDTDAACVGTIGGEPQTTCYHYFEGDLRHEPTDDDWPDGLYYVDGDVTFNGSDVSRCDLEITIVATGKIKMVDVDGSTLCAPESLHFTAYTDLDGDGDNDLLLFSNKWDPESRCNPWIIDVSSSAVLWTGIIFAPYGSIAISGSNLTSMNGAVWGYTVNLSGAYQSIEFSDEFCAKVYAPEVFLIR